MNKKSIKNGSGKRTPLKTSSRGDNIYKEPSISENGSVKKHNTKERVVKSSSKSPRRSLRKKTEGTLVHAKENRVVGSGMKTLLKTNSPEEPASIKNGSLKKHNTKRKETKSPSKSLRRSVRNKTEETPIHSKKNKVFKKKAQENIEVKNQDEKKKPIVKKKEQSPERKCDICTKTFTSALGYKNHYKKCTNKTLDSVTNSVVQKVINGKPDESQNKGTPSPVEMESTNDIKPVLLVLNEQSSECHCCGENVENAHKVGDFQCYNCNKLFVLKASLERHQKVIHLGESHECPQCGAKCPDKGTLARHMYTHTGLKPYSCPVCKQEFSRKYHLVRHNMQTGCDGKEKPVFPCQVCGREFNRKDNLREHLRAHAGQTKRKKMFSCDSCGMEFCGTNLLQIHKRIHSGEKRYCCDLCPKRFPSSGAMKKHRRTHTGERPFECSTCGKRFAAKETLNRHIRIHTGHKPHGCEYCGKRFIQSSQLRSHLFYHTGRSVFQPAEVFICELCGKTFNRRARLNEHTKFIHLGAKPFECEHCKKTFIRKEDLNRHLIIHSGVKAHKCPICCKSFAMKSSLKVHLLTHTKEPPRSCDECGRAFIRQDCLLRHMRNKHRDMLEEIRSEAEKKKLQQQLLQVAAEASLAEGLEDRGELDERGLTDAVSELLTLLVDEVTLSGLNWPSEGVESVLESVIKRCGHEPAPHSTPSHERLRHNVKLLFTVVIDDSAIKALLNNQTIDQVILHVLRLAKS